MSAYCYCAPVPCTGGAQVTFDYNAWVAAYPQFSAITPAQAQNYFNEATIFLRNDGTGPVKDPAIQATLLGLLTAHLAQLFSPSQNQAAQGGAGAGGLSVVGRVDSITVGPASISAQLDLPANAQAQFFGQTQYGLEFWAMTAFLRTFRWRPGPLRVYDPWAGPYRRWYY